MIETRFDAQPDAAPFTLTLPQASRCVAISIRRLGACGCDRIGRRLLRNVTGHCYIRVHGALLANQSCRIALYHGKRTLVRAEKETQVSQQQAKDYEELQYTNNAFPSSHPMTLATVATLYGLASPNLDACRVLELGCGRGGNLLPMAESMPGATFVGIDLSPSQIEEANTSRDAVELRNIEFHTMNLCDIDREFGEFDYVLAHGVYSWVPSQVQDQLLRVCDDILSPHGLAYVSFNTYPGWHYRGVIRDLLNQFVDRDASAKNQVAQTRQLLAVVAKAVPDQNGIRTKLVLEEIQALLGQADGYIFHDHLEQDNRPCYFREFSAHAEQHGLKFVAEAQANPLSEGVMPPAKQAIRELIGNDRLQNEQMIDFLTHRTFRRSILCRAKQLVSDSIQPDRIRDCYVTSCSHPSESQQEISSTSPLSFVTRSGDSMTTTHPLVKTTLFVLHELGQATCFSDLASEVSERLAFPTNEDLNAQVAALLVMAYHRGAVQFRLSPAPYCSDLTPRPIASPVARYQSRGDSRVTNREHRSIDLIPVDRLLLTQMDGGNDIDTLSAVVLAKHRAGEIAINGLDHTDDGTKLAEPLKRLVESRLRYLATNGFVIG